MTCRLVCSISYLFLKKICVTISVQSTQSTTEQSQSFPFLNSESSFVNRENFFKSMNQRTEGMSQWIEKSILFNWLGRERQIIRISMKWWEFEQTFLQLERKAYNRLPCTLTRSLKRWNSLYDSSSWAAIQLLEWVYHNNLSIFLIQKILSTFKIPRSHWIIEFEEFITATLAWQTWWE